MSKCTFIYETEGVFDSYILGDFVADMHVWALKGWALFKYVGQVVCVYVSLDACWEDGECYILFRIFKGVHQCLVR